MPRQPHRRHIEWQGGHYSQGLKNQYRILDGGRVAEVRAAGGNFFVDVESLEKIHGITWELNCQGYAQTRLKKTPDQRLQPWSHLKQVLLHRYLTNYNGPLDMDHVNRKREDNILANLRILTRSGNCLNCKLSKNNTSGINGLSVDPVRYRWRVRWYENRRLRSKTWKRDPEVDEPPEEVMASIVQLRAQGAQGKLKPFEQLLPKKWRFKWHELASGQKSKRFEYSVSGLIKALQFKREKDDEIGNTNGY